jgi:hypothetical protein
MVKEMKAASIANQGDQLVSVTTGLALLTRQVNPRQQQEIEIV